MCKTYAEMTFSGQQKWSHSCCAPTDFILPEIASSHLAHSMDVCRPDWNRLATEAREKVCHTKATKTKKATKKIRRGARAPQIFLCLGSAPPTSIF